jgi:hypothetical protein
MDEQNLFDFIDAVSDANTIMIDYEDGESERQNAIDGWQRVLVCLDKLDDNIYNIQTRVNVMSVLNLLSED